MSAARERLARVGSKMAVGLALAMLGYRLWDIGLAPFIQDEPAFLAAARQQLLTGQWVSVSPLIGTQGIHYGPSVLWFYGGVQWLLGAGPRTCIVAMCLMVTAAHLALAWTLARLAGGTRLSFAAILAFIASSPYQFFWSRLAWDQLVNVCACWAVVLVAQRERFGPAHAVALGLVLGVALSSHPMVLPLVACVAALLLVDLYRTPRRLLGLGALALAGILLVNVPYLRFLLREPLHPTPAPGFSPAAFLDFLVQPARVATGWGIQYFFDGDWGSFLAWLGSFRALLEPSPLACILSAAVALAGLLAAILTGGPGRRLALLASATWLGCAVFYGTRNLDRHPHYQFPVWWVVAAGIACAMGWAFRRSVRLGRLTAAAVLAASVLQFGFIPAWMAYVRAQEGTRGIHYSTPVASQLEAIRAACAGSAHTIVLRNATLLFPQSLAYLLAVEPDCAGKRVLLCPAYGCPPPPPGGRGALLRYARPTGGALTVQ